MEIKTYVAKAGKWALTKARQGVYSLFLRLLLDQRRTGRGLSERKLNGPGCTVDWTQLGKFLIYLFVCIWIACQFVWLLLIKMVSRVWTRARLGCTVDWVQLRTSTSPQLTVAILNLVQLEDYGATFYSSLFVSYFFVFFLFCKLFPSKLSLFAILNLLQLNGYDATFCCWPFVFLFFVCFDFKVFFRNINARIFLWNQKVYERVVLFCLQPFLPHFWGGFLLRQREKNNLQGLHLMQYKWWKIMQLFVCNLWS